MNNKPQLIDSGPNLNQAGLAHRVLKPEGPGPHPTIVMIHGHLGNEDVMWIFARTLPPNCLLVAPRANISATAVSHTWHMRAEEEWPTLTQFDTAVTAVSQFIHALPQLYQADLNQLYLMGFSQGAAVSLATAVRHPGWIKGLASLVGFAPLNLDDDIPQKPLQDLPVFMAAGLQDERIPIEVARNSAKTVRALGAALQYTEYDTGHKLNIDGMHALKAWWAAQRLGPT